VTPAYEIVAHSYDVVIVGAGGAGLRAALEMAHARLARSRGPCSARLQTGSHAAAFERGIFDTSEGATVLIFDFAGEPEVELPSMSARFE